MLCSPAQRTRETLEAITPALGDSPEVVVDAELYGADADQLLARLHRVAPEIHSAMLIGHNPGIHDLALELSGTGEQLDLLASKFPTGALATLEFDESWRTLRLNSAELTAFVRPKDLS